MSLRIKQSLEGKKSDLARQGYFLNKAGEKCFSLGAPKGKPQALALEDCWLVLSFFLSINLYTCR
jgi:hypothetical protein